MQFEADAKVASVLAGCADEMVEVALQRHNVGLDFSDASVQAIERIVDIYWRARPANPPDPAAVDRMVASLANDVGGYLGETFRRNHGGAWGYITEPSGNRFPGFQSPGGGLFWPTGKVRNRLTNGPEDNLAFYYDQLVAGELKKQSGGPQS